MIRKNLLDLNVLIALTEPGHQDYSKAQNWFSSSSKGGFGICPLTEAGFVRVTTNPAFQAGPRTLEQARAILEILKGLKGFWYCEMRATESWIAVTSPFASRILGHQQVTDAYLLGLAIKEDGVLVTLDRGLKYLAGPQFARNLLVLE